jgi:hypothetical protein
VAKMFLEKGCSAFVGAGTEARLVPLQAHIRRSERADIAILVLNEAVWSQFAPEKRFTRLSEVHCDDPTKEIGGVYCAFGYPSNESNVDHPAAQLSMVAQSCFGLPFADATQGFDASKHIAIHFDPSAHPDPGGMSGGGVWRIHQAGVPTGRWTANDIRLVAIEHTWGNDRRALYGTRMEHVFTLIKNFDQSLGPAMDLVWPGRTRSRSERWVIDGS